MNGSPLGMKTSLYLSAKLYSNVSQVYYVSCVTPCHTLPILTWKIRVRGRYVKKMTSFPYFLMLLSISITWTRVNRWLWWNFFKECVQILLDFGPFLVNLMQIVKIKRMWLSMIEIQCLFQFDSLKYMSIGLGIFSLWFWFDLI